MNRPAPVRDEAGELRRQIGFNENMKARVFKKAEEKAGWYDEKIEALKAKLAEAEASTTTN